MTLDFRSIAKSAGLDPSTFTVAEWTRIVNAMSASYTRGYDRGYSAAVNGRDPE